MSAKFVVESVNPTGDSEVTVTLKVQNLKPGVGPAKVSNLFNMLAGITADGKITIEEALLLGVSFRAL